MAHYPNDHPVYGQSSSYGQHHPLRRMPSYSVGDESGYLASSAHPDHADPRYAHLPPSQLSRTRATSQSTSQYQYAPASSASVYNPQQYSAPPPTPSRSSLPYNPLAYAGAGSFTPQPQPYNPAAYQPAYPSTLPPPPPPRGPDHPYGSRPSPQTPYGFAPAQSYPITSPMSPTNTYASGSPFSAVTASSRPFYPPSPRRSDAPLAASPGDDHPPAPPAHSTAVEDPYGTRLSLQRLGSGRALPTPPVNQAPSISPPRRTDTLTRHPQSRPLPGPPVETDESSGPNGSGGLYGRPQNQMGYDDLMEELEVAVRDSRRMGEDGRPLSVDTGAHGSNPFYGPQSSTMRLSPDERHTHTNGSMATGTGHFVNYDAYSDADDAEAAAGLAMLQMAEEEDRAQEERQQQRARRETNASIRSAYSSRSPGQAPSPQYHESQKSLYGESDYPVEYGGGVNDSGRLAPTSGSLRSSNLTPSDREEYSDDYDYPPLPHDADYTMPSSHARVDARGTGGLAEPGAFSRRMSFDYGDEVDGPLSPGRRDSGSESSDWGGDHGDLFFHPGMRPLPPAPVEPASNADLIPHLMPAGTYRHPHDEADAVDPFADSAPYNPFYSSVNVDPSSPSVTSPSQVPRSSSLSTHPIGPRADPPIRSKTDADRAKYKPQPPQPVAPQEGLFRQQPPEPDYGALPMDASPPTAAAMALDLPTIPAARRKKFNPAKLSSEQFRRCAEPWALSAILEWVRELSEDETDLRRHTIVDALVALFTHKVPTMNIADAETLAARVVNNMLAEGALVQEEEWVKFGDGTLSGVLFQITGTGCYSSRLHEHETKLIGRCYSHHCMRTLKKVNLKAQLMEPQKKVEDWVTFYKVPKELWESYPKKEIDRQNNLHEIVTTEDAFIGQLDVLRELYRDQLAAFQPPVLPAKRINKFLHDVFGRVDFVKRVNEDHLLAQLKYRQKEQGPFIVGFSDIFREWIRKAKTVYIDYAANFPYANYLVRKEAERNGLFRSFLNQARDHKLSNRLSWDTYLKAPITRIQRYTLLLGTAHKNMLKDSEEKANLAQAIDEIKLVALECDNKVGEMSKKVDLIELGSKLQLRPEMKKEVELNLEHLGREVIFRGDLQRPGTRTRFLVDTHAILFDHYLVLAKSTTTRDLSKTAKYETYDISKLPIPMDLLVIESTNEDPVVKSSVRGVSTVTQPQAVVTRGAGAAPLMHTNSGNSASSGNSGGKALVPATVLENSKDDKILFPFKIKHLGTNGTYTLYAFSVQNRQDWCDKILEAKTKHAAALFAQNAEPFRLRVLADTAFANSDPTANNKGVMITGTPLDRAIKEVEQRYDPKSRPPPVCRTNVHCATVFQQPGGRMMCAIGTDYGVYISDYNDPRGWARAIPIVRVTQIAVFEDFNLFLLIADKSLIAYHLDVVCPPGGVSNQTTNDSARRAPQKLSGAREVGFFAVGHMKERTLVMYKKRDGLSSTFKVLEPVLQKSASSRSRFSLRRSQTEFFREYDEFYIPTESYGINMFNSSLAISTQRGIEILTLDKKQSWSVPDFRSEAPEAQAQLSSISHRINGLRPLGMFRLSDSEFLVVYIECAIYVNKHGDISRSVVMEFVGSAHSACLYGKFLLLFNDDFVEVRNAMNGRLRQVIPGHNVVCLDDGSSLPGLGANSVPASAAGGAVNLSSGLTNGDSLANTGHTVKISMQHPEHERSQIILELIENEGQKD